MFRGFLDTHIAQQLDLLTPTILKGDGTDPEFAEDLERAVTSDRITWEERNQLLAADLISSSRTRDGRENVMVVAEISITTGDDDIDRAKARALILARVQDWRTIPAIISASIDLDRARMAQDAGAIVMMVPAQ